jgi:hypothetical protein
MQIYPNGDVSWVRLGSLKQKTLYTRSMSLEKGAEDIFTAIQQALQRKEGLLIGRNGTIELETLLFKLYVAKPGENYPSHILRQLELNAGIFPATKISVDRWVFMATEAIRNCDVLVAGWYKPLELQEKALLDSLNSNTPRIPLRSLEPYYVSPDKRWTQLLQGQKVAIVNAFVTTCMNQVQNREEIWPVATDTLLPSTVEWVPIRTGYSPALSQGRAGWGSDIQSWDVAVMDVVKQVINSGSKIALIGCGGMGLLIASELKKRGIIAVVMGGSLQVLFGIKGNRWEKHDIISHFWNESWVYPSVEETPKGSWMIEGGCYWGKKN